jgi:CRISPR/Cas system-associated exonuclease Cas4 (RecB family)
VLHNSIEPKGITPIEIRKTPLVMENLMKLNEGNSYFKGISPSALNSYIECRLKFYFRHVAKIREADEVEEELDARVLGNFLHHVMERFYKGIVDRKKSREILPSDFNDFDKRIEDLIDEVFIESYRLDPSKKVKYEGQRLVVREMVKRFSHRIIEMDRMHSPFYMEALEMDGLTLTIPLSNPPFRAVIGGKIDRVDRKENQVRIIDYKTGKDKLSFESVASLFVRDDAGRNKAAFQTLLYAMLYRQSTNGNENLRITPGLINRMNLFDEEFSFGLKLGRDTINDIDPLLPEFEQGLRQVFEELFDPTKPFDQTTEVENCQFCPYGQICYR